MAALEPASAGVALPSTADVQTVVSILAAEAFCAGQSAKRNICPARSVWEWFRSLKCRIMEVLRWPVVSCRPCS